MEAIKPETKAQNCLLTSRNTFKPPSVAQLIRAATPEQLDDALPTSTTGTSALYTWKPMLTDADTESFRYDFCIA